MQHKAKFALAVACSLLLHSIGKTHERFYHQKYRVLRLKKERKLNSEFHFVKANNAFEINFIPQALALKLIANGLQTRVIK